MLVVFALVMAIVAATQHNALTAFWSSLAAISTAGWLVLDKLPTTCGMPTKRGQPCRRETAGVLFGCHDHTWEKFFAWFGWHRREPVRRSPRPSYPHAEIPSDPPSNKENKRGTILFRVTITASFAAIVSMVTDLIGLFR